MNEAPPPTLSFCGGWQCLRVENFESGEGQEFEDEFLDGPGQLGKIDQAEEKQKPGERKSDKFKNI